MNSKKVFYIMVGIISLFAVIGIAGAVFGNSMLQKRADKLLELKLENRVLEEQEIALIQANKDIEKYQELEAVSKAIVPQDKDQARTVREIVRLAELTGVHISTISFPSSNLGQATPAPAPTTSGDNSTPAPTTQAVPPVTQVKAVDGIPGVFQLEINVQVDDSISYEQLIGFLERLEQNRRTAQVTSISIQPAGATDQLTFNIVFNVFIKP